MVQAAEKILVIHLAGIGDLLLGLPALSALREAFPTSRLTLLTWRKAKDLARLILTVDDRYALDERGSWQAMAHNRKTIMELRSQRIDLAINLYSVYRWVGIVKLAVLLRLIHPKRTAGRDTDGKGIMFDLKVMERSSDCLHEVERQLAVSASLRCPPADETALLALDPRDQQMVEAWLNSHEVKPDEMLIDIHPGGARAAHRWPWRSFARLAQTLEARYGARIAVTGSYDERGVAEQIAHELARPLVAAGALSLDQLAWLFRRCRLVIANDSGPMHLAAVLKVPLVAIMGPTDPLRYGPYPLDRPDQRILYAEGCAPCYHDHCNGHEALEQLPVEAVLEAAEAILKGQHPRGLLRVPRRIRVLHVHTLPAVSGSGMNTFLSMRGQRDAGFGIELASAASPGSPGPRDQTLTGGSGQTGGNLAELVTKHEMRFWPIHHLRRPISPWHDLCAVIELWHLMRRERYTIVHTHNSKAGVVGRLAAKLARVPIVIHTVHGFAFHPYERWWRRQLYRLLERLAARWSDRLIMISQPLIDWALGERIAPQEKMVKIYSGIDLDAFRQRSDPMRLRATLGLGSHDFLVGEVAKLWKGKGHEILLQATARLTKQTPSLKLLIVGDGPLWPSLEQLARELHIEDRVVFTGFRTDIPALTQLVDVAVLPTLFEGMGRSVIEAQAAGKPVIASRVGGIPDLIVDGVTGLLIEPGNIDQLASAIERLYEQPTLRHQLGEAAQQAVDSRFDAKAMSEQIVKLYDELLWLKLGLHRTALTTGEREAPRHLEAIRASS